MSTLNVADHLPVSIHIFAIAEDVYGVVYTTVQDVAITAIADFRRVRRRRAKKVRAEAETRHRERTVSMHPACDSLPRDSPGRARGRPIPESRSPPASERAPRARPVPPSRRCFLQSPKAGDCA